MKLEIGLECKCGAPLTSEFQPANNVVVVSTCVKCADEKVEEKIREVKSNLLETVEAWEV